MKKILTLTLLTCISSYAQNSFEINGRINDIKENAIVYIKTNNSFLDSCYVKNKEYVLTGKLLSEPSDVLLIIKENTQSYEIPLFIGNEKISIDNSLKDLPFNIKTKGSKYDGDRFEYMSKIKEVYTAEDKLLAEVENHKLNNTLNDSIYASYFSENNPKGILIQLRENYEQEILRFIKNRPNSHFALRLLNITKEKYNKKELEDLLNQFNKDLQFSYDYTSVKNHLNNYDIEVGDKFIEFEAYNSDNVTVKFSSFFTTDFTLLNFSSMYCHWCEEAKIGLNTIKEKFKTQIQIINFYIDEEPNDVENFLNKKSSNWEIIWDPERKLSKEYMNYKIKTTPTFYLFNKQGYLIKKIEGNTRNFEKIIEETITEYLK